MPNHFHILLTPGAETSLEKALQMIKGGSAHRIRAELAFRWPVWQPGFHDRWLCDAEEYVIRKNYILENPVKAKLAKCPREYMWSSARARFTMDPCTFDGLQGLKP